MAESNEQCKLPEASTSSNEACGVGKVPYHKLFSFADPADYALMVIGLITAVGSGLCLPLMTLIFGELANAFGQNVETKRVAEEVAKVLHIFMKEDYDCLYAMLTQLMLGFGCFSCL